MYDGGEEGEENAKPAQIGSNVLGLFLQSVGVVLSDIQDVIFKYLYAYMYIIDVYLVSPASSLKKIVSKCFRLWPTLNKAMMVKGETYC